MTSSTGSRYCRCPCVMHHTCTGRVPWVMQSVPHLLLNLLGARMQATAGREALGRGVETADCSLQAASMAVQGEGDECHQLPRTACKPDDASASASANTINVLLQLPMLIWIGPMPTPMEPMPKMVSRSRVLHTAMANYGPEVFNISRKLIRLVFASCCALWCLVRVCWGSIVQRGKGACTSSTRPL